MDKKMNKAALELLSHPGETLQELIQDRGLDQQELAIRTGFSTKHIGEVLSGACDITLGFARAFENVFGTPAIFWTNLQTNYDREKLVLPSSSQRPEDMNIRR